MQSLDQAIAEIRDEIVAILDLGDHYADLNRSPDKHADALAGLTQINMFFENSTRTQASFELAGKRALAKVFRSGEIDAIYDKWFGPLGVEKTDLLDAAFQIQALPN